ncbi:MAG: zinc dependent phospholipase C family protein [Desulfuromonadales bacterium]|nr:zinc dependent phospholipase C family protein [Desulfuromonadales bacterium]
MKFLLVALLPLAAVFFPTEAWAWGVGVHLQVGSWLLQQLPQLPLHLQTLLTAYPHDYLYGCISADITLGKKYTHYLQHCHSWRMGRKVLAAADDDSRRACAYGYLSHLAADAIAHGYYVPYKLMLSYNTALLQHAYWEMRFEANVDQESWNLARALGRFDFSDNDRMLRTVLADTIFSFDTNKRLFNSLLLLNRLKRWQRTLAALGKTTRWPLHESDRQEYLDLACAATLSLLKDFEKSPWMAADPTGERALAAAGKIRRNLHILWLDGKLSEAQAERLLLQMKKTLREGLLHQDRLLKLTAS